ncbi:hypothetical protein ABZ504_03970, partial [Streptomyces mirabilis]
MSGPVVQRAVVAEPRAQERTSAVEGTAKSPEGSRPVVPRQDGGAEPVAPASPPSPRPPVRPLAPARALTSLLPSTPPASAVQRRTAPAAVPLRRATTADSGRSGSRAGGSDGG